MPKSKTKNLSPVERFLALSDAEKDAAVAEFDREFIGDTFGPLTPAARRQWERAKRKKPGRPRVGKGAERVLITVERGLLSRTDAFARKNRMTRSQLIAKALESIISRSA
jgi:hypothetical protein